MNIQDASLKDFAMWIGNEATYSEQLINPSGQKSISPEGKKQKDFVLATSEEDTTKENSSSKDGCCLFCAKKGHEITKCFAFLKLEPEKGPGFWLEGWAQQVGKRRFFDKNEYFFGINILDLPCGQFSKFICLAG